MVYYNEIDPYAAQWLRNLIAAGHIAKGEVDERSIQLVDSADLADFAQCHFFAGIGVWSHALRLAGWPDDRPVWTGSCPCQPFSAAGKGAGFADERHLWPEFFRLIRERRPSVVFGEQVASKDGLEWLDLVQADLEGAGYASAAADLCAAGVGAPHIRQRLYWVADAESERRKPQSYFAPTGIQRETVQPSGPVNGLGDICSTPRNVADADDPRLEGRGAVRQRADQCVVGPNGVANGLADASDERHERHSGDGREAQRRAEHSSGDLRPGPTNGHWRDADWLYCRDGKWRPVEPGTFPLAYGAASRVGRLRAYGNAIVPQVAQGFIEAFMECRP
jgi:DNA (cytosine-5)-methyltransferase 1